MAWFSLLFQKGETVKKMREEVSSLLWMICRREGGSAEWPELHVALCDMCSSSQGQDKQASSPQSSMDQFSPFTLRLLSHFPESSICS